MSIPVICDRCRSVGDSGEGDFSHLGDLLDFEPVPRRKRVNGWDAEAQRAFIAALAMTGSKTTAAKSLGRNAFGIDQLLKAKGSEGFRLAFDRALAIAEKNGAMRIATGVADAAARNAWLDKRSALRGHEPPEPEEPEMSDDLKLEIIDSICRKYFGKARQEREARLSGEIVAADFYLRQMTFIEVGLDLAATDLGTSAFDMLKSLQRDGHGWMHIAETPFSRALDEERRRQWGLIDEPERPERPARRYFEDRGDYSLEPDRSATGALTIPAEGFTQEQWAGMDHDEQTQARKAEWARAAEEQVAWEAKARAEFEKRQAPSK
jgi:hypothetical protein